MTEGTQAFNLYYVESGTVEVTYGAREKAIIVAFIKTGELFGEIGFFDHHSRVRTLRATEDSIIRTWDQESMERMKNREPVLYGAFVTLLARSICAKFRRVLEEREPLVAYTAALSTGRRSFQESEALTARSFQSPFWPKVNQLVETFKSDFFDLSLRLATGPGGITPGAFSGALSEHPGPLQHGIGGPSPFDRGPRTWRGLFGDTSLKRFFPTSCAAVSRSGPTINRKAMPATFR